MDVMGLLLARGAQVSYADPYVPVVHGREWPGGYDIEAVEMTRGKIAQYDCVVIITDHKAFDYNLLLTEADLIVDTRNAIKQGHPKVFKLGAPRTPAPEGHKVGV
jgi:UDP-N-acetyl-D-glucosamine dehydrogenase